MAFILPSRHVNTFFCQTWMRTKRLKGKSPWAWAHIHDLAYQVTGCVVLPAEWLWVDSSDISKDCLCKLYATLCRHKRACLASQHHKDLAVKALVIWAQLSSTRELAALQLFCHDTVNFLHARLLHNIQRCCCWWTVVRLIYFSGEVRTVDHKLMFVWLYLSLIRYKHLSLYLCFYYVLHSEDYDAFKLHFLLITVEYLHGAMWRLCTHRLMSRRQTPRIYHHCITRCPLTLNLWKHRLSKH